MTLKPSQNSLKPGRWIVVPDSSTVSFSVRHLAVKMRGKFESFAGTLDILTDGTGHGEGYVDVTSIDTGIKLRDQHLLKEDCFNAERYPRITATADLVARGNTIELLSQLTIMDSTRPLLLEGKILSSEPNELVVGLSGSIRRRDFDIQWGSLLEAGKVTVGDRVTINLKLKLCCDSSVQQTDLDQGYAER